MTTDSPEASPAADPALRAWFLSPSERGNPTTDIDRRRGGVIAYTDGNDVQVLIHGAEYFPRLLTVARSLRRGTSIHFTDWRGDPDERLAGPGTEIAQVLATCAADGAAVRGLVWRSHLHQARFSEQENLQLVEAVNDAGGEVLLDERVRRDGSHHQKLFVIRHADTPETDVAFVGGIDLCHGRRDDERHGGDDQAIELDRRYGPRPPWHDMQLQIRGPAVGDLAWTFRERWNDPTPLDHRNPWRALIHRRAGTPPQPDPLPPAEADPPPAGNHAVQVLRTYPAKRPQHPFARNGERSIARAYLKAFGLATHLVYVEDQYLWSGPAAEVLGDRLRAEPRLHVVAVVPRYPDQDGRVSGPPYRIGQQRAIDQLMRAGGDRVAVFDLESASGWPIYVHSKVCVIDDVWMIVGSDNLNIRSWTNDSELSCAVIDHTRDQRQPLDPGGRGDGARALARDTRLRLWREHLGRDEGADEDLIDGVAAIPTLRHAADQLDRWNAGPTGTERPPGRLRLHHPESVGRLAGTWAEPVYRLLVDPDGRPRKLRRAGRF